MSDLKTKAHNLLNALHLPRPKNCAGCGKRSSVHAHHRDYARPLWILWLCPSCHANEHAGRPAAKEPIDYSVSDCTKVTKFQLTKKNSKDLNNLKRILGLPMSKTDFANLAIEQGIPLVYEQLCHKG